jgi:5-methylcytosine-specific restriction endonuclease McrA
MAATIEHIIPLCVGGTHTWDNVAPAHAMCNFKKGDSLPEQFQGKLVM